MADRSEVENNLFKRLWGFLTSRRLAVVLLLSTLALLLLGLFFPQEPVDLGPAELDRWRAAVEAHLGEHLSQYERWGLTHLYRTPTFLALLAALLLNTLCCTLERLGRLWRAAIRRPPLQLPLSSYGEYTPPAEGVTPGQFQRQLRRQRYRVQVEETSEAVYFYGERFRWAPLGTVLSHLGLFFVALAALLHLLESERLMLSTPLCPSMEVGGPAVLHVDVQGWGECSLANIGFEVVVRDGSVRRVRGRILEPGGPDPREVWIAPGRPASICGVSAYLASYDLALQVKAYGQDGLPYEVVYPEALSSGGPLNHLLFEEGVAEGRLDIPSLGWHVTVVPSVRALAGLADDPLWVRVDQAGSSRPLFEGEVLAGNPLGLEGVRLEFARGVCMMLEWARDPGLPWFLAGGLSLFLGSVSTLLFPHRRFWVRLDRDGTLRVRFPEAAGSGRRVLARALGGSSGGSA